MNQNRLESFKVRLLAHAMMRGALKFSDFAFKLKSGRMNPYFFNSGAITDGKGLELIGQAYAATICFEKIEFDVLFGPAYKGIPLATLTATGLWEFGINVEVAYNRKEAKDHGEGGILVGADIKSKRMLIIDDVITVGTAVRESIDIIRANGDEKTVVTGIAVMLDRQEKGTGDLSAVQEVRETFGIPVVSILTLDDIINFIDHPESIIFSTSDGQSVFDDARKYVDAVKQYREQYGV